ncbi:STAS domain-containing protein, partial [Pseudomonas fragi]|nr:STAS domain-containing protein [Pseudomonas sp. GC01]
MAGNAQLDTSSNPARLRISGDWTLAHYTRLKQQTEQLAGQYDAQTAIDLDEVSSIDTAGASLLVDLLGAERVSQLTDTA